MNWVDWIRRSRSHKSTNSSILSRSFTTQVPIINRRTISFPCRIVNDYLISGKVTLLF
jgi:hypothetical protein